MKISKSSPDLWTKLPEYTLIRTLTTVTCTRQELVFKILLQCYSPSYFLCSLNMTTSLVSPITMFTNLWNVTQSRHFHLLRLLLQYQILVIQKHAWLIEVKKRGKHFMTSLSMLQCIDTWKPRMFAQRFLKFRWVLLTRIFGITSGSGPVILVNQNFLTLPFLTNRFIIAALLLTYVANSEKGI